ncbi:MAG TPA: EsaB/YukD family protein [Symbiobacteriaceae bacterium]|nr:EsaB/YukD family protein [Symbiobacteriaceae bacterium]
MRKVLVTVTCEDAPFGLDLELPADVAVRGFVDAVAQVFRQQPGVSMQAEYRVEACRAARILGPDETLARAGVWDGAWLHLQRGTA